MTNGVDLTVEAFLILRGHFFDQKGLPKLFPLREKRNTQDNPLDEYICDVLDPDGLLLSGANRPAETWHSLVGLGNHH